MKMYILIKDTVPNKFVPVIAAHASLACFRKFEAEPKMQTRITASFKKVVCKVSSEEFEKAKIQEKCQVLTESALNNEELCLVFCPRPNIQNSLISTGFGPLRRRERSINSPCSLPKLASTALKFRQLGCFTDAFLNV
ncbi:MAG: hypothetical protein ACK5CY_09045 [Bacteroidia bacterium]